MQTISAEAGAPLVWITGAGGLIGNYLAQTAPDCAADWRIAALTRERLDLLDFAAVRRAFFAEKPAVILHCAALSKSPACQKSPELAHRINVEVTARLAELAGEQSFVFLSTDLVFDGKAGFYDEFAAVNPLSVYGETKAKAEQIVLSNPRHLIIRTSLNGGQSPTGNRGFNEEMRMAWGRGETLRLFTDEYRCPISAKETARAVWNLVTQGRTGLFHVAGSERLSRWDIGQLLARRCPELNPKLEPASLKEYAGAPRAPDTSLNCSKAQQFLPFPLPGLTRWLEQHPGEPF